MSSAAASSASASASASTSSSSSADVSKKPISCLVIGMAGSGKTTFMQRVNAHANENDLPLYMINMDPAVPDVPFQANIDIRDTVNYKEVMKYYQLGPNGGILTSLNLFATRFDYVMKFIEKRCGLAPEAEAEAAAAPAAAEAPYTDEEKLRYIFLDTPGQIEIFTWSASGSVISESLASTMPTCIAYIIDTPRCYSPVTFMSNMLYACSIMYKTKLPFIIVFNKTDVIRHDFAVRWMSDFYAFYQALNEDEQHSEQYSTSLAFSMSLVLDEFYNHLTSVGVSAVTGDGMDEFFELLEKAKLEYAETYLPELEHRKRIREYRTTYRNMKKLNKDLATDKDARMKYAGRFEEDEQATDNKDSAAVVDLSSRAAAARARQEAVARKKNEEHIDDNEQRELERFLAEVNLEATRKK